MSLLELESVALSVPTAGGLRPILRDVSLHVAAGEALGLVGESGSGKSMTLRAVLGTPPAGSVVDGAMRFDGEPLAGAASVRAHAKDIGVIGQDPRSALNPVRTVGAFLVEALVDVHHQPIGQAREHVAELLRMVGLDDVERVVSSYPHQLSGGMLQRVCIAAALATGPRLLLADEPTTALDVTTQSEVMAIVDELRR